MADVLTYRVMMTGKADPFCIVDADNPADAFETASLIYATMRDESGEGASTFPEARIYVGAKHVARISYNGKVWPPRPWTPDLKPLWPVE